MCIIRLTRSQNKVMPISSHSLTYCLQFYDKTNLGKGMSGTIISSQGKLLNCCFWPKNYTDWDDFIPGL